MRQDPHVYRSRAEATTQLWNRGFRSKDDTVWVDGDKRAYVTAVKDEVFNRVAQKPEIHVGYVISLWEPKKDYKYAY